MFLFNGCQEPLHRMKRTFGWLRGFLLLLSFTAAACTTTGPGPGNSAPALSQQSGRYPVSLVFTPGSEKLIQFLNGAQPGMAFDLMPGNGSSFGTGLMENRFTAASGRSCVQMRFDPNPTGSLWQGFDMVFCQEPSATSTKVWSPVPPMQAVDFGEIWSGYFLNYSANAPSPASIAH